MRATLSRDQLLVNACLGWQYVQLAGEETKLDKWSQGKLPTFEVKLFCAPKPGK